MSMIGRRHRFRQQRRLKRQLLLQQQQQPLRLCLTTQLPLVARLLVVPALGREVALTGLRCSGLSRLAAVERLALALSKRANHLI